MIANLNVNLYSKVQQLMAIVMNNPFLEYGFSVPDSLEPQATLVYHIPLDDIDNTQSYSIPIITQGYEDIKVLQDAEFINTNGHLELVVTIENQGENTYLSQNMKFKFKKII